jgi:undecaprenyl pyrophosphate phosphatase UppP
MKKIFIASMLSVGLFISSTAHACLVSSWVDNNPLLLPLFRLLYPIIPLVITIGVIGFVIFLPIDLFSKKEKRKNFAKKIWKVSLALLIGALVFWFIAEIPATGSGCGEINPNNIIDIN